MDRSFFNQPNEHFVSRLIQTSETRSIVATEDIYDQYGIRLLGRGEPLTPDFHELLISRSFRKPLETSLRAEDSLRSQQLADLARQMFAEHPTIAALAGPHQDSIAEMLGQQKLTGPVQLLLTALAEKDPESLLHVVITASISASLAQRLRLSGTVVGGAITAGLVHDIGEFYVDPLAIGNERDLSFEQWKKVAMHPRIGALLLNEFSDYPAFIARAVQEHHERLDGSGYPSGLSGGATSELGQILMIAEMLAAVLPARQNPQASAMLAVRLVPGQFASQLVATLADVFDERADTGSAPLDLEALKAAVHDIDTRLRAASIEARRLCAERSLSNAQKLLAEQAREVCARLVASLHSTGVIPLLNQGAAADVADPTIALELQAVTTELKWRMRALARHIALAGNVGDRRNSVLCALLEKLYGSPSLCNTDDGRHPDPMHSRDDRAAA